MAKDPSHLIAIGSYYTDTIHFKLQELSITDETEIDNHPLMQAAGEKLLSLSASEAPTNDLFTK